MIAVREVLCATALEHPARAALRYSFFVAERFNATLSVVHARDFVQGGRPNAYVSGQRRYEQLATELHELEQLDAVVRSVPTAGPGRATTHVVDGNVVDALVTCADRYHADLVVLGNSLRRASSSEHEESVAGRIGDRVLCPVLTVPHTKASSLLRIQRILCPVQMLPGGTKDVIAWVVLMARQFGAIVEVLHDRAAEQASYHDDVEDALRVAGVATTRSACARGARLSDIALQRVADGRCDLIVMSATAADGEPSAALASIRRDCATPVLSVPPSGANRLTAGSSFRGGATLAGESSDARAARCSEPPRTTHEPCFSGGRARARARERTNWTTRNAHG